MTTNGPTGRPTDLGSGPAAPRPIEPSTWLACAGCDWRPPAERPIALACGAAVPGDGIDHVLQRHLDPARIAFPIDEDPDPFVRYRTLFHAYHAGLAAGWSDAAYVALVRRLDDAVMAVDGHDFRVTPFGRQDGLSDALGFGAGGGVWVKDETGNVSGSHKARHLFGTLLELSVADMLAGARRHGEAAGSDRPLAIASCGNAALAAAVVARAAERPLDVFIPPDADPAVVGRLRGLGARLTVCDRDPGVAGDPTYHGLLRAVADGAVPFTCQGNLNGLAIEGGETLGWELVGALATPGGRLDRLVVQVGGGALASSAIAGFRDAQLLGVDLPLPRLHAVQTRGGFPLARAYERLADRLLARIEAGDVLDAAIPAAAGSDRPSTSGSDPDLQRADLLRLAVASPAGRQELDYAARHRGEFMWPWETEPRSIAHGILDDETYDWLAVVEGMLVSGGYPVVVDEPTLAEANVLAVRRTGIPVDHTGSAGLAGLIELVRGGAVDPAETVAVLFTGVRRAADPAASTAGPSNIATRGSRS
ncbi:MAG: pyridoxal-phosphate dependent enzyme [Candidatus Limnocylindrales bacterium]